MITSEALFNGMAGRWSAEKTFRTLGRPNILVIVVDDGRYDNYTVNGGPEFFQSPTSTE
jgi:arylsulfatase A-like enzyme